jgi:hypothetical protein
MGFGDFIKAGVRFFSRPDNRVTLTLTQDQAEHVHGLVAKEQEKISRKMHDLVDKGALEGKAVPISSICVGREGGSPT